MRNIVKLNGEIENIFNPKIVYQEKFKNILFNGKWVSDIKANYFNDLESNLKEQILLISDDLNPKKVNSLKIIHQKILKKYEQNLLLDFENLDLLKTLTEYIYEAEYPDNIKPKNYCTDVYIDFDSFDYFYPTLLKIYNTGKDYDDYLSGNSFDEIRDYINLDIIEKYVEIEGEDDEDSVQEHYAYTHLSLCLSELRYLIRKIAKYIENIIQLIHEIESFEDENLNFQEIYDNDPTNIKLEFKINKMEVALFFRALHDTGIIFVDNINQKFDYTNLKKYINTSNMYYLENKKVEKIDRINKEFTKIRENAHKTQEIKLLESIIAKLSSRKEELLADKEEGLL